MDNINQTKFINNTWNLEMSMENHQILHDQLPFSSFWPSNYPPQLAHQTLLSPSSQILPTFLGDQTGNNISNVVEGEDIEEPEEEVGPMKEMMYRIAAMQPVDIDPATIRKPKRRNVRISDDPQSVAARLRRERISEKIRILQRLVPGGRKLDTASMLDEAIRYVKFLKKQIRLLNQSNRDRDWQVFTYNKPLGNNSITTTTTNTSSLDPLPVGLGFAFGGNNGGDDDHHPPHHLLCFNEVKR